MKCSGLSSRASSASVSAISRPPSSRVAAATISPIGADDASRRERTTRAATPCAISERQAVVAHERVSELGDRHPAFARARRHPLDVELGSRHGDRDQADAARGIGEDRGHERLQIVLGIDNVAERRVVGDQRQAIRLRERFRQQRARVLQRDRIALLRHDAADLHEIVRQPQVADLARAPQQHVLDEPADADERHRRPRRRLRGDSRPSRCCRTCSRSGPSKPSSSLVRSRSIGKPVPVIAQAPSGFRFVRS